MNLKLAYNQGVARARVKLALDPPTQVDDFMASIEQGKDVPPSPPPMAANAAALDGTLPMQLPGHQMEMAPSTPKSVSPPTPTDTIGSTVGHVSPPPPSMGMLSG